MIRITHPDTDLYTHTDTYPQDTDRHRYNVYDKNENYIRMMIKWKFATKQEITVLSVVCARLNTPDNWNELVGDNR